MNRPEGISPDAWEKADAVLLESPAFMIPTATYQATQVLIAKAIQSSVEAERDACALIAEKWKRPEQPIHKQMEVMLPFMVADDIGQKIRSRKGA